LSAEVMAELIGNTRKALARSTLYIRRIAAGLASIISAGVFVYKFFGPTSGPILEVMAGTYVDHWQIAVLPIMMVISIVAYFTAVHIALQKMVPGHPVKPTAVIGKTGIALPMLITILWGVMAFFAKPPWLLAFLG
jgi:hypothetical protein